MWFDEYPILVEIEDTFSSLWPHNWDKPDCYFIAPNTCFITFKPSSSLQLLQWVQQIFLDYILIFLQQINTCFIVSSHPFQNQKFGQCQIDKEVTFLFPSHKNMKFWYIMGMWNMQGLSERMTFLKFLVLGTESTKGAQICVKILLNGRHF